MRAALDASKGTAGERAAVDAFAWATEQASAREAWAVWIERGY